MATGPESSLSSRRRGSPASQSKGTLRLRTQLMLALAVLAILAVALTSWVALSRVEDKFSRIFEQRVEFLRTDATRRLETVGLQTAQRMRSLAAGLLGDPLVEHVLVRPAPGRVEVIESAARMRSLSGLELLQIVSDEGTILSSAQWPERAGFQAGDLLDLPEGAATFRRERTPQGEVLSQVVRSTAVLGQRRVHLIGGKILNEAFLREASPAHGEAALLLDARGESIAAVGSVSIEEFDAAKFSPELAEGIDAGRRSQGQWQTQAGSIWSAGSLPIRVGPDGPLLGTLVLGANRAELDVLVSQLRRNFLVIGTLSALLAAGAGLLVARRITRSLERLVRGVDLISAGREHDPFPTGGEDEIGRLMTAFSRMDRSLRVQQKRLLAAERVAAWKEVAQRVAHEVKNPLSPIRLTVENLIKARRQAPEMFDELFDDGTRTILEEVNQLGTIVTEFSEFARLPTPSPQWVNLDTLVDSVISLYSKEPGLMVRRIHDAPIGDVFIDSEQISRAVQNLVKNAVEAMEPEETKELQVTTGLDGENVYVEVCDTGRGFPQDTAGHIFEPYFTTKEKGTGLGMAIALRIIAEHGGSLSADNRPGGGARVTVTLPRAGATQDMGTTGPEAMPDGASENVAGARTPTAEGKSS